jgi:hypothetical protein
MLMCAPEPTLPDMLGSVVMAAVFNLDGAPRYIHEGWFLISDANLVVIVLMIAVFALAIALPFPGSKRKE